MKVAGARQKLTGRARAVMRVRPRSSSRRVSGLMVWAVLGVALVGLVVLAIPFSSPSESTAPLRLQQKWIHYLDDAPCGLAEASPTEADIDGTPATVVGDREGELYAFALAGGAAPAGWSGSPPGASVRPACGVAPNATDAGTATPIQGVNGITVPGSPPVDSTVAVVPTSQGEVLAVDAGDAGDPSQGGYYAYSTTGTLLWHSAVTNPPTDPLVDLGVQASPTVYPDEGTPTVIAGSLGQETYALGAHSGQAASGWPFFSADSVFSTAAVGDLYGNGEDDIVMGGASTSGFAYGAHYENGGQLRILNAHGGLICSANTTEEIDSSPAIGPILSGGALGIATGTGSYWQGSDLDTVKVFDTECNQVWSRTLDGTTGGSPALADIDGNGQLAMVEGTNKNNTSGSVWALDPATGATIWKVPALGAVIGSVATADLSGSGVQDVIVATTGGIEVLDGKTGQLILHADDGSGAAGVPKGAVYGFQNTPLVTDDPNGTVGITVAGYFPVAHSPDHDVQGMVQHFTVSGSKGALADERGGWPQFHHDAELTGATELSGVSGASRTQPTACEVPSAANHGYVMAASDGGVFTFSGQPYCGSASGTPLNAPVVGIASSPDEGGYWLAAADGGVFSYGLPYYGSAAGTALRKPIVGIAATPNGHGYWLVAADGGIFSFGDAGYFGSASGWPNQHVVGMAPTRDGEGYWEVTSAGAVFWFGDARPFGDAQHLHLAAPIVGMAADPATGGYWLVAADGGVFSFNAPFFGSTGPLPLRSQVVALEPTDDGGGYWIVAADGGVFTYGDAPYEGSEGGKALNRPITGVAGF